MAKTGAQRQKDYIRNKKSKDENFNKNEAKRKSDLRNDMKKDSVKYKEYLRKERERKRMKKQQQNRDDPLDSSFGSKQSSGKALAKTKRSLPGDKSKKAEIVSKLLMQMSPSSKNTVFTNVRRRLPSEKWGRPSIAEETRDEIISFLERPDISYCCPGRKDTVYCGKSDGKKVYKPKRYLLWSYREMVTMFNKEHQYTITYHTIQQIVKMTKEIFRSGDTPDDDCRCERCENVELLLMGINRSLKEKDHDALVLPVDPQKMVDGIVCSVKQFECCNDKCAICDKSEKIKEVCRALKAIKEVPYAKWVRENKKYVKKEFVESGKEVAKSLRDACSKNFKLHMYSIYRQYSELKYLKRNLKEGEVICSVDFSRNYENKQKNEIQNAYFGHEAFTIFTAACYFHENPIEAAAKDVEVELDTDSGLQVKSVVIVSNETVHERNISFSCNNRLIEIMRLLVPSLNRVYLWSDGCASQFRSQYVFRSLSQYPEDLKISWDYGEAHHFKGPHDGIGGTVKRKVYRDVTTMKVIVKDARHFASYANATCNIQVDYLHKTDIAALDLSDSKRVYGTLKVHHVERLSKDVVECRYYSNYKTSSDVLTVMDYGVNQRGATDEDDDTDADMDDCDEDTEKEDDAEDCDEDTEKEDDAEDSDEDTEKEDDAENSEDTEEDDDVEDEDDEEDAVPIIEDEDDEKIDERKEGKKLCFNDVKLRQWVKIYYEMELFVGRVEKKVENMYLVRCLEKPFGINLPQEMEKESHAIFYENVYDTLVEPVLKLHGRKYLYSYEM